MDKLFWKNRRVLVTGHTGFKGSWLILLLQNLGANVSGYSLEPDSEPALFSCLQKSPNFITLRNESFNDILDLPCLSDFVDHVQPEVIFHLAAQPLVRQSYKDPLHTWSVNLQGSLNVLEAAKKLNHQCSIVMVTTDKVYENKEWEFGYREMIPLVAEIPIVPAKLQQDSYL